MNPANSQLRLYPAPHLVPANPELRRAARIAGSLRVEALPGYKIGTLSQEWQALCSSTPVSEPFLNPEWPAAYLRFFAPAACLRLFTVRDQGELLAVLPLIEERARLRGLPVRSLRAPANHHSVHFEMAIRGGADRANAAAVQALAQYFSRNNSWDVMELPMHLQNGAVGELTRAAQTCGLITETREAWRSLQVPLNPSVVADAHEPWLSGASTQFRKQIKRKWTQMETLGPLTLRRADGFDSVAFEQFCAVEQSGWKGAAGTAIASNPQTLGFYESVARQPGQACALTMYFLDLNGSPIAAHFGLTQQGRYLLLKAGYDEAYAKFGPGHLLVNAVLHDLWQRGLQEFDFLGPAMPDEARWTKESRTVNRTLIFRAGVYGRMLHTIEYPVKEQAKHLLAYAAELRQRWFARPIAA